MLVPSMGSNLRPTTIPYQPELKAAAAPFTAPTIPLPIDDKMPGSAMASGSASATGAKNYLK